MKAYNIYYNNEKLNNSPISEDDLKNILNQHNEYIYKKTVFGNTKSVSKINIKNIKIIECIIV